MNWYDRVYVVVYRRALKTWSGDSDTASWLAMYGISGVVLINGLLVVGITVLLTGPQWLDGFRLEFTAFLPPLGVLYLNYRYFVKNHRYRLLADLFEGSPQRAQRRVAVAIWVYVAASFAVPIALFSWAGAKG